MQYIIKFNLPFLTPIWRICLQLHTDIELVVFLQQSYIEFAIPALTELTKLKNFNMDKNKKSNEGNEGNFLYELGQWASFPVQMVGYFPLSVKTNNDGEKSKAFKFSWISVWPIVSIFLTVASFSWCFGYFWRYKDFKSFIQFKTPTETGAFNLMILATNISGIYTKLFGLINGRKYEAFWNKTKLLLDHFNQAKQVNYLESHERFLAIRNSCRTEFFLLIVPVVFHVLYIYVWSLVASLLDADIGDELASFFNADTQVYLGLAFGSLIAFLHVSNSIWMNFFVKIYSECLISITEELKNLRNINFLDAPPFNKIVQTTSVSSGSLGNVLDKLAHVDDELARFNEFFGTLLLLQISNCVINLLVFSFFACLWMGRGKWQDGFLETVVPLYLYGKELLDMGTVAENLSAAADSVLIALAEDVMLGNLGEEIYLRIQIISVQLCTKPPVISARQFFTINRGLVTSVMSALATFLVVLVQFREQDDDDAKQAKLSTTVIAPSANNTLGSG